MIRKTDRELKNFLTNRSIMVNSKRADPMERDSISGHRARSTTATGETGRNMGLECGYRRQGMNMMGSGDLGNLKDTVSMYRSMEISMRDSSRKL